MLPQMRLPISRRTTSTILTVFFALAVGSSCSSSPPAAAPAHATTTPSVAPAANTPTKLPSTETFGVGRRDVTFVDRSRKTEGNTKQKIAPKDDRTLPTVILYPTTTRADDATDDDHPVAPGRFPLLVFSHGVTASGPAYVPVLKKIAAAGYVVALPTYPLTSGPGGWDNVRQAVNQPADVSFLITELLGESAATTGLLSGHLAAGAVGIGGHSLGAITSLLFYNSCCQDPRVKAVVAVSGILFPTERGNYDDPPAIPLLMLHGEEDSTLAYDAGSKRIFDQFTDVPRALVSFPDAGHVDVLGKPGFAESMIAFLNLELRADPTDWHKLSAQLDTFGTATIEVGGGLEPPT